MVNRLSRDRSHDFPPDGAPPYEDWAECSRCGMPLPPGSEPRSYCSGLNQRSSGLQRSEGSLQRTPLSPVSDSNSGREHQKDEAFRAYVRSLPCLVCGEPPPSDPHHVRTWGSGHGDRLEDGTGNLAPLCRAHHRELDSPGSGPETFAREHDVDLAAEAERVGREFKQFRRAKA